MSFGLALSGGGIRGATHVGVLLALEEAGMVPDSIAGASAGGIVAGLYAAGYSAHELRGIVQELVGGGRSLLDPDYLGLLRAVPQLLTGREVKLSGFLKGNRLEDYLCGLTGGKMMRDLNMLTVIPCADLTSGLTIACTSHLRGVQQMERVRWSSGLRICEVLRATSAVPAVFRPKLIGDLCLVDGGVTDVLPVNLLIAAGEPNVLAVDVGKEYRMPEQINIWEVATHSLSVMQERLQECVAHGEKLQLIPHLPDHTRLLDFGKMEACMEAGYEETKRKMPEIKRLFSPSYPGSRRVFRTRP